MHATKRFGLPSQRSNLVGEQGASYGPDRERRRQQPEPDLVQAERARRDRVEDDDPHTAVEPRFIGPTTSAMIRSSRWWTRYDSPERISVAIDVGGPSRFGLNDPRSVNRHSSAPR